ncbi:hypothetical protein [Actinomadura logoneensis]|uniref:hypothetical protein n=1 Tax=Actinomadura logoneensis TaxID=2293572 RepID=UPI0011C0F95D|nr:hypothetical protein [Actinomadura logoneensis]
MVVGLLADLLCRVLAGNHPVLAVWPVRAGGAVRTAGSVRGVRPSVGRVPVGGTGRPRPP